MILDLTHYRFFLRPENTDLRKGTNGLSVLIQQAMEHDPFSQSLFPFCNKQHKLLKIVYWDRNGHCHIHLIPRRKGDVDNPKGGVRHIIPGRGYY